MMQNAQMHQMVMQQMMLSALPKNNSLSPITPRSETPVRVQCNHYVHTMRGTLSVDSVLIYLSDDLSNKTISMFLML